MPDTAYFDSCLFIELLQQDDPERFAACECFRAEAVANRLVIVTSAITITEVNKLPESDALREDQSKQILAFFQNPYIAVRAVDRQTAEYAHELTRTNGLTNLDAIHVATAILSKVPVLYTYDDPKSKRKGLIRHHLKIGTPPLRIEKPPGQYAGSLFDEKHQADKPDEPKELPPATPPPS